MTQTLPAPAARPFRLPAWTRAAAPLILGAAALALLRPDWSPLAAASPAVKIHLAAAVAALALGAFILALRKGVRAHRIAGWTWSALMVVVAGSSLFITGLNGDHWSLIHLLSGWTLATTPLAVVAARRHKVAVHRRAMTALYFGGLIVAGAFTFAPGRLLFHVFFG